jgi:hypothetical protein
VARAQLICKVRMERWCHGIRAETWVPASGMAPKKTPALQPGQVKPVMQGLETQ